MSTATATLKHMAGDPKQRLFLIWVVILGLLVIWGVVSGVYVFVNGLGVTGLTDQIPWGLWIALDLSAISLGAGAFIVAAITYLLKVKRFESVARVSVLGGFLGYSSAMFALALDIGRPDRFYHPVIYWNVHSVLWEITMCVIFYFSVLALEMAVPLFESRLFSRWPNASKIGHTIHKFTPVLAVIGLALSLLHQSSLGATYGVVAARPLWYKPSLPVLFILSAAAGGMSATMFVTLVTRRITGKRLVEEGTVRGVAVVAGAAMLLYLYLKIWDWAATTYYSNIPSRATTLELLTQTSPYNATFWWIEVLLGGLVPAIIYLWPRLRQTDWLLMLGNVLAIAGVVMLRWNVTISGLVVPQDWSPGVAFIAPRLAYHPTIWEFGAFFGIIGYALLGLTLGLRFLPIYPDPESDPTH